MLIQYKDFCIRSACEKDVEQLVLWWNDGSIMEHAGFPNGLHITSEKVYSQIKNQNIYQQRLLLEKNKSSVGEMSYTITNHVVEIGIKICDINYQNKGYGKLFLSMLIEYLFQIGCTKIVLDTMIENKRAQHVYESLGFVKKGVRVDCWKDQLGNMRSAVDYQLVKENFNSYIEWMVMEICDEDCELIYNEMLQLVYNYEDLSTIDIEYVKKWMYNKVKNHMDWYRRIIYQHQVIGYYAICDCELEDFYIIEGYQNMGIGSQVMEMILDEIKELCVFKKNVRAIAFYKRFGFEIAQEMKTRYIMKKGR